MRSSKIVLALAFMALPLSACSVAEDGEGTKISITADNDEGGETKIAVNGNPENGKAEDGKFSIRADGFSMDIDIPTIEIDAEDFDLNDVALYPGSKITTFNINANKAGKDDGEVTLTFEAPAKPAKVIAWFEEKMNEEDFVISKSDSGIEGKTNDGENFSLKVDADGQDKSKAVLMFPAE